VPHWGKLFTMAPEVVRSRYAKLGAARDLVQEHDPAGKFRNAFVDRMIFA
jgi:xylitol oxidase